MQFYITFHPLFSETDKISDKGIYVQSWLQFQQVPTHAMKTCIQSVNYKVTNTTLWRN